MQKKDFKNRFFGYYLYCFLALIATLSCTEKSDELGSWESGPHYYNLEKNGKLLEELKKSQLSCKNKLECPNNVGMILFNNNNSETSPQVGQCTGFLIDDDIVATNSHCIPSYLKNSSESCEGKIGIRFISTESELKVFMCKELISYSPQGIFDPDYAFFKIENSKIRPFKIYKGGLTDKQKIKIIVANPLMSVRGAIIEAKTCQVQLATLLNLKSTNKWSRTGIGFGCDAISGNSGSPVLNKRGEVLGILQSEMKEAYNAIIADNFSKYKTKVPEVLPPHFLFTSLSCIKDPVTNVSSESECINGEKLDITDCTDFLNEKTNSNSASVFESWKSKLPEVFKFEITFDVKENIYLAHPICVKTREQINNFDNFVVQKGIFGNRKDNIELNYTQAIKVGAKIQIENTTYHLNPELQFFVDQNMDYVIKLVKERKSEKWEGFTNSLFTSRNIHFDLTNIKIPLSLMSCTVEQADSKETVKIKSKNGEIFSEEEFMKIEQKNKRVCLKE
jgi:hypothetical protein